MTVQEMHIGFNLWYQKINSQDTSVIKPEEIDWILTEECLRYIKQRMSASSNPKRQGFQSTQKRYDDVEELITSSTLSAFYKDGNTVFGFLPTNYFRLINDRSLVKNLCGSPLSSVTTINQQKGVTVVPFPDATETSAPFYMNLQLFRNDDSSVLFDVNNYITTINGVNSKEEKFYIINLALEKMNSLYPLYDKDGNQNATGIEVRWENFDGKYYPNSFIFVTTNLPLFTGVNIQPFNISYPCNFSTFLTYSLTNTSEVDNRLTNTEELYKLLDSNFASTFHYSPISTLARGKINVHHKQKFILSFVKIDYIRKPRKIDLFLNQSCELNPNVHEEIVEAAARRVAGITKGENYQPLINENLINE